MRVGVNLPQIGAAATPALFLRAAQRAEALGYASLWVWDRLLYPVRPQTPYPASRDGALPAVTRYSWDPIELLTFVAAHTRRIALGTSVLNIPHHNPVVLARRLATLDVLSGGRLRVGLGVGWSKDEFDALGVALADRGRMADEFLRLLKAIWTTDPVEFHGRYYELPRSSIGLKPVQKPHPPIYLAAYAPAALKRVAAEANGWNAAGVPVEGMAAMMGELREQARVAGRDPAELEVVVRANVYVTASPAGGGRAIFTGSFEQIRDDVDRIRALGVTELFFDLSLVPETGTPDAFLSWMERFRQLG